MGSTSINVSKDLSILNDNTNITNLTSHDLIMEIVQNLFIHNLYISHIYITITNTFDAKIYKKMRNSCDICSFICSYFICQHFYSCVKCVFNVWYSCVKCINPWINELCTIFIINSSHVKFVINNPKVLSTYITWT